MEYNKLKKLIWIVSGVVALLVIVLHEMPKVATPPLFTEYLPLFHALLNGTCFILLITALVAIKKKNVKAHQKLVTYSMILSIVFLLSYVTYHFFQESTPYHGDYKGVYYFVLITHIILAGVSLPFILLSYAKGYYNRIEEHRKMVKFVYPIWLYVTFTGVLVYVFLEPYYNF